VVFSSSRKALKNLFHSVLLQRTLGNDYFYKTYTENLDSKSNLLFYIDVARAKEFVSGFMNKETSKAFNADFETFRKLDALSCQMNVSKGMIYNSIIVRYNPQIKEQTHSLWQSRLDSTLSQKPVCFENPKTKEKEILVQDDGNTLYLIGSTGRIIWKNHLPEQIRSEIFLIPGAKNIRFVFSTRNYIYTIDHDGNFHDRFPVKLQSPATNGIGLSEPSKNGEFTMIIACTDKKVYCYKSDGNMNKNWKFDRTENPVYGSFQFFTQAKKSYVVFADTLKYYLTDLNGKETVKIKQLIPKNRHVRFFFEPKNKEHEARIVTDALEGTIVYLSLKGTLEKKSFGAYSGNHFFEYRDLDTDGSPDYIFLDDDKLTVINKLNKKICSFNLPDNSHHKPEFYEFPGGDKNCIGLVCEQENKIFLVDRTGNLPRGFPLEGNTPFTIQHFTEGKKTYNLITGNKDGFLYNYEVY
jgi:hypothetical protein